MFIIIIVSLFVMSRGIIFEQKMRNLLYSPGMIKRFPFIILGVYMKARELQENLLNDTERFSSEEEHQRAIEALSKDLDAVKQSILDDSKIVKKGVRGISVKIYPENE